jgi:hypothetical protein
MNINSLTGWSWVELDFNQGLLIGEAIVCFGSLADICSAKGYVRFTPNRDHESDLS